MKRVSKCRHLSVFVCNASYCNTPQSKPTQFLSADANAACSPFLCSHLCCFCCLKFRFFFLLYHKLNMIDDTFKAHNTNAIVSEKPSWTIEKCASFTHCFLFIFFWMPQRRRKIESFVIYIGGSHFPLLLSLARSFSVDIYVDESFLDERNENVTLLVNTCIFCVSFVTVRLGARVIGCH